MIVRTGKNIPINYFLLDAMAVGFTPEEICAQFREIFSKEITPDEINQILDSEGKMKEELETRTNEIMDEIKSKNLITVSLRMIDFLEEKVKTIEKSGDGKAIYATLSSVNTLRGYIEMLLKKIEAQKAPNAVVINQQNNYLILEDLEKQGFLVIKDKKAMKRLLRVPEEEDGSVQI